jgi:hypothetical protein
MPIPQESQEFGDAPIKRLLAYQSAVRTVLVSTRTTALSRPIELAEYLLNCKRSTK